MRNAKYPIYALNNTTQHGCSQTRDALSVTYSVTVTLITSDITKKQSKFFFNVHCFKENNDKHSVARNTVFTLLLEIMHCALT